MGIQINGSNDTIQADDGSLSLAGSVSYEDVTNVTSVGLSTFSSGIHIDDSITHLGDTNTKIRFPAVDTVTVETTGTERLRIDSSGVATFAGLITANGNILSNRTGSTQTVFQGTLSGVTKVNITAGGAATFVGDINGGSNQNATVNGSGSTLGLEGYLKLFHSTTETHPWLQCYKSDGASSFTKNIEFFDDGSATFAGDVTIADKIIHSGDTNTAIRFPAADTITAETGGTERLRINANGNIGAGVAGGTYTFQINDTDGSCTLQLTNNTIGSTSADGARFTQSAGGILYIQNQENSHIQFSTNGSDRMRLDSSGNLMIGTTTAATNARVTVRASAPQLSLYATPGWTSRLTLGDTDDYDIGKIEYANSDDSMRFTTNASERLRIDNSGRVMIGNTAAGSLFGDASNLVVGAGSGHEGMSIYSGTTNNGNIMFADGTGTNSYAGYIQFSHNQDALKFGIQGNDAMMIDSSRRLLIGTATAGEATADNLTIADSGHCGITLRSGTTSVGSMFFADGTSGNDQYRGLIQYDHSGNFLKFATNAQEVMRINSDGTASLGIVDTASNATLHLRSPVATEATRLELSTRDYYNGSYPDADIVFTQQNGTELAKIQCDTNTAAANMADLVFHTNFGGLAERMRIDSSGNLLLGTTDTLIFNEGSSGNSGVVLTNHGSLQIARPHDQMILLNRQASDGALQGFYRDGVHQGGISVASGTVTLNGAHLSRWSQLPGGAERTEILLGTVLSNLDEMCEWGEEDNQQLNRMKVSDVEGDRNVSGVFQSWDDDDDTYTNDFYCAMTGDFVIRIAQGTTVARGDLLMSAGDGTAKPQDDDIVRSKTIAKVTSTTVSATYSDGSYCVPCVLMAC